MRGVELVLLDPGKLLARLIGQINLRRLRWRREQAIEDTRLRRPDLIERHGGASQAPPSGARRDRLEKTKK
jgi:hypothetical protein